MSVRKRIFIPEGMQASCLCPCAALTLAVFCAIALPFAPVSNALADSRYEPRKGQPTQPASVDQGFSPAREVELRALRQQKRALAEERIRQATGGTSQKGTSGTPRPLVAPPPPPRLTTPFVPPPPPLQRTLSAPTPPTLARDKIASVPVALPVIAPLPEPAEITPPPLAQTQAAPPEEPYATTPEPAPVIIPEQADVASASASSLSPPWHSVGETPPPKPASAEVPLPPLEAVMPEEIVLPVLDQPEEGVIADKTYLVVPGGNTAESGGAVLVKSEGTETAPVEILPTREETVLAEAAAALEAAQAEAARQPTLSEETEEILRALPEDIIGRPRKVESPGPFNVDRMDPDIKLPDLKDQQENVASTEAQGMKVAVKQRPIDVNYELEKAYVALTGGSTQEAIAIYKTVLEIDGNNEQALFGLATTFHRVGLLEEARPIYGKLLKLNPRHKDAINNFLVLVGEEAPERALEHMSHLERDNPEFAPIPAQMALLYAKIGNMEEAIRAMQRAANLSPENLVYKYNLAILYDQAKKPVEASMLYRQLLEARYRGEVIPADADDIQQRLTFLLSNS